MNKYLSNIELYYSSQLKNKNEIIISEADDFKHIVKVMRHSIDDEVYVTNGEGKIFKCKIFKINKDSLTTVIEETFEYDNILSNIIFCIPKLKSHDRFEFALEKCVELGITSFIIFDSERTISKGNKVERWNKILISAMKQSLRSYLPKICVLNSLEEINNLIGEKIVFEQNSNQIFDNKNLERENKYYFIFGPEGGLSEKELNQFNVNEKYKLASNRLRTETSIIKCASLLNDFSI